MSGKDSTLSAIRSGPVTSWPIPAASRSLLDRVPCTRIARGCLPSMVSCSSLTSGSASIAAARGSAAATGISSLATISDSTTMRTGSPPGASAVSSAPDSSEVTGVTL